MNPTLGQWITQHAGGNPLYVQELCQALEQSQSLLLDRGTGEVRWTGQQPDLPLSLHALLLSRLDELALPSQEALKRAAVIGLIFSGGALIKLCQPHLSPIEVQAALEDAITASFVAPVDGTTYRFTHPLLQETIYATVAFSQRQRWHTQIGDGLAEREADADQFLELMAYHYLRGADPAKAADFGLRAGNKARERGIYAGAAEYYSQVLALPNAPFAQQAAAEGQGDVLALLGNYPAASAAYTQAAGLGSLEARGKQVILSGDLEVLGGAAFTPALCPWANGARAWLLAQRGQVESALRLVQSALEDASELAQPALEALAENLSHGGEVGPYEVWIERFVQTTLTSIK